MGGAVRPKVGPGQSPGGDWGWCPQKKFSDYAYEIEGNYHIERMRF